MITRGLERKERLERGHARVIRCTATDRLLRVEDAPRRWPELERVHNQMQVRVGNDATHDGNIRAGRQKDTAARDHRRDASREYSCDDRERHDNNNNGLILCEEQPSA